MAIHTRLIILLFLIKVSLEESTCELQTCGTNKCNIKSFCSYDFRCICPYGFTSDPSSDGQCCYEQKKQMWAFFLEFMLFFGAGHFYIGQYSIAIPKLLIFIVLILINLIIMPHLIFKRKIRRVWQILQGIFGFLLLGGFLVWQIADIVVFAKNQYKDSNNIELLHW